MIRINLLPVRETRRAAVLRQQGLMLTSALALAVVVCIGMQLWVSSGVSGERERVAQSQAERARLAETLNRIDVFQAEEKEISRKLEEIETLELVVGNGLIRNCTRRADRFTRCERKIDRHETLVSGGM